MTALQALARASDSDLRAAHALFGRMTSDDWKRWAYKHTDHHLLQFSV